MPAKAKQMPAADMAMPAPQNFQYTRDACKTKAGACSRHGDACATFFGTSAMPARHKQMPAADMAMPAPQSFRYARDACITKADACSRHGDACVPFFGDKRDACKA